MLNFSIIIPTRNRAKSLEDTLSSFNTVVYPYNNYEIIVVNNDPEDTTPEAVVLQKRRQIKNLTYTVEPRQGSSFARNKGIELARYKHLIFLDDDILVKPEFLLGYKEAWLKYPKARILGGRVRSERDDGHALTEFQQLLLQKYSWCFAHLDWVVEDTCMSTSGYAYSANLSYRLDGFEQDIFSTRLGVQMYLDEQLGAEDFELCLRTLLKPEQTMLLASREVEVRHRISVRRFHQQYLAARFFMAGIEMCLLEDVLRQQNPHFQSFYKKRLWTFQGIKQLLIDKYERKMLLSYLMNGKYFI